MKGIYAHGVIIRERDWLVCFNIPLTSTAATALYLNTNKKNNRI
jgi:hypothetical protein